MRYKCQEGEKFEGHNWKGEVPSSGKECHIGCLFQQRLKFLLEPESCFQVSYDCKGKCLEGQTTQCGLTSQVFKESLNCGFQQILDDFFFFGTRNFTFVRQATELYPQPWMTFNST